MTFNEGMQIDTSTASSSGGGGGLGMAFGGGGIGLLILVVALFLGVDPGKVMPPQQSTSDVWRPGSTWPSARPAPTPTSTCNAAWSPPATRWTRCGIS